MIFRTSSSAPLFIQMYFSTHNVWDFSTCPPPCRTQVDGRSTSLKSISILSCKIKSPQHTNTEIDSCGLQGRKGTSFCLHEEVNPQMIKRPACAIHTFAHVNDNQIKYANYWLRRNYNDTLSIQFTIRDSRRREIKRNNPRRKTRMRCPMKQTSEVGAMTRHDSFTRNLDVRKTSHRRLQWRDGRVSEFLRALLTKLNKIANEIVR